MKKIGFLFLMSFFVFTGSNLFSQKIKSGNLSVLKGQKLINLQFDYSKMKVGKYDSEEEYIKNATADRNKKKDGAGDAWAVKWRSDQMERYPPAFTDSFNDRAGDCNLEVKANSTGALYTMIVHTEFLEQGVEAIVGSKASEVDLRIDIVETKAPEKIIATVENSGKGSTTRMSVYGAPVSQETYDAGLRVSQAYSSAGKSLAKFICKELK